MTIGPAFIDEVMVLGEALAEAHDLENRLAVFPRVALSEETTQHLLEDNELSCFVNRDFNGPTISITFRIGCIAVRYLREASNE